MKHKTSMGKTEKEIDVTLTERQFVRRPGCFCPFGTSNGPERTLATDRLAILLNPSDALWLPLVVLKTNSPEAFYNNFHITDRNSVERAIDLLRGRFRCLSQGAQLLSRHRCENGYCMLCFAQ
ncbi:hypothetical protein HW555_003079 [Spodoptera exigua]|uniref:Uncharacterized protein n=1 Tax=Spodoptera exigua TaxID=7107 RepID=A0A835GNH1_SPOEX|nr:hypothetical protein HW555_003079 [Spodoptera exigua]